MPRVVDHEERREQIAEAAWRVIEREGVEGANLRGIAREAGYTTGVITHYFADKRELMSFAFGLMVERSTARMAEAVASEGGVVGALAQILPLDEERRRETTVWLTLMGASLTDPDLASELRQRYRQAREAMLPVFGPKLGKAKGDPQDVADELLAVVDGITVDALTDPERYPPARQLSLLERALERIGGPTKAPAKRGG